MKIVKAAAVQISPVLYSREGTVAKVVQKIHELGQKGVQFATFPETVVPYYPYFSAVQTGIELLSGSEHLRLFEQAVAVPSAATDAIGEAARKTGMVVSIGVNERDGGTLYNTQLLFDADGVLIQRRRKITPTHFERMIWGQGDGSGLRAVDSAVGRIGQLACFEHNNPLARYAMIADGEQIHSAMYPGSAFGEGFAQRMEINIRQHALESGAFVVNATAWLDADQQANHEGHGLRDRPDLGWLFHHHRIARRHADGRAASFGRRRGDRRSRLHADRPTQDADGRRRPLQPSGTAQSDD